MTRRLAFALSLALMPAALLAGCEPDKTPKVAAKPKIQSRETINKKTQDVMKLKDALDKGGVAADMGIPVSDPLSQAAAAHRTIPAKMASAMVQYNIQLRNASNIQDPKPLTYDEFMAEILKKGKPEGEGMWLQTLPYYQEYAWDEEGQKLVVVDFPAKKAAMKKQTDEEMGR